MDLIEVIAPIIFVLIFGLGKVFELAHTANIFQAKKLGMEYPIDALAVQTPNINNKVTEALNE